MAMSKTLRGLALTLLAVGPASAQDALTEIVTVDVRPGTEAQFEEFARALVEAARQQGSGSYWRAAQSVSGTPNYTFSVSRSGGWSDMALAEPSLAEAFGDEEAARLEGLLADSVQQVDRAFYRAPADLSYPPPAGSATPAALVFSDLTINPGMMQQYIETARRTNEASRAILPDAHYIVFVPQMGTNSVRVVGLIPSWGDLDEPFMPPGQRAVEHFGEEEGRRLSESAQQTFSNITVSLHRPRPDLGYQPEN